GNLVGWIQKGEWLTYDITVPTSGTYQLVARVASGDKNNHSLKVTVDGKNTTVNFGTTGGWQNWQSVLASGQLSLNAGTHQLRLDMLTSDFNINYLELVQPIRIEAEKYRNGGQKVAYYDTTAGNSGGNAYGTDDVDVSYSGDVDGGNLVGWIQKGEWLTYDITVPTSGTYQLVARVASGDKNNHSLKVTVDGKNTTVNFGTTGDWRNWQSVLASGQLSLSAGTHQLRLDMLTSDFNINYLELIPVSNFGNSIQGNTGNNTYTGSNGIDTITYNQARGPIVADLGTGVVNHKFATSPDTPFKIMPLGDSNTFGMINWDSGAYRDDLWNLLKNGGFNIDFVGSRSSGPDGFDKDNAGFGGWRIRDIASNKDSNGNVNVWLDKYKPDRVLMMIGTNDIIKNDDISNAPSRLSNLIDQITNKLPNTQLLVSSIPPISTPSNKKQSGIDFNSSIPGIVSNKVAQGKKVTYVDVYSALTPDDLQDGVHPTKDGYGKVANVWHKAILNTDIGKDTLSKIENMIGSPYNDTLVGNGGVNIINGGGGNDSLTGGDDKDTFVLSTGQGTDTITDFIVGKDLLGLSSGLTFGQLTITQANNGIDTWINNGNEWLASLSGIQASTITSDVFTTA
ncbi:carbohydrate-binding protein, partial [Scytonema sp. NUACC26]|uniref:carbohydrate-binding protein n=1 Tax=Scytonema sp. NUACC26 TaxID=3140176 RepID=UPI0038B29FDC